MKTVATFVTEEISKICSIISISFGDLTDKSTWRIDFFVTATTAQKKAAAKWLADFDLDGFNTVVETQSQIQALEVQQTPRRLRDAALGQEELMGEDKKPFMQWLDEQVAALRNTLPKEG